MATSESLLLQERIPRKNTLQRFSDLIILFLLLWLVFYRLLHLNNGRGTLVWRLAFVCELWFTFAWVLVINSKWNLVDYQTHPQRLILHRLKELPTVDMFVTTADCMLESPIITVNTLLSLLAVDYPPHKLACYVSDDGCSPITYYSLKEACKFAKTWLPFCKKYSIQARAPADYFATVMPQIPHQGSTLFFDEWREMKEEYEQLCRRIEVAVQHFNPSYADDEFADFRNIERSNHPSIVKVIWENKVDAEDSVPHLVYVSREKRQKKAHNFKAGAMNALLRVSGVMTNAPFTLNVDCDMFVNNPQVVLHAMCLHLGVEQEKELAFVQCPQLYHSGLKDDPFGNEILAVLEKIMVHGWAGIQGPSYQGTGCFHRRKAMYGSRPDADENIDVAKLRGMNVDLNQEAMQRRFGFSAAFVESATEVMLGRQEKEADHLLSNSLEAAKEVAGCNYEQNTCWGNEVGLIYGTSTEDIVTGLRIQSMGWSSKFCTPDPPGFLGSAPSNSLDYLIQQKRWATGLLEVLIGKYSPVLATLQKQLLSRQCLAYLYICVWPLRSVPETCYVMLPAFAILTGTPFLPKVSEPALWVILTLFIYYNIYTLVEFLNCGFSVRVWWNNQRMRRITSASSWLFTVFTVPVKLLGWSESVFEVTRKEQSPASEGGRSEDSDAGRFTFNSSPLFLPGTTIVLVHSAALMVAVLMRVISIASTEGVEGSGLGEGACCVFVLLNFLPFVKGLFGKGCYGIPWPTVCKATALGCTIIHWCMKG